MLPAKLFAALALVFAAFAGVARLYPIASLDVGVHSTYFVVGPMLVVLFCLVTSANFAVLYYAGHRFVHARWNRALSLLHFSLFLCFAISLFLLLALFRRATNGNQPAEEMSWVVIPFLITIFSFAASFLIFAVNLTTTVVQLVRAHLATR
jgi:heme/copper-type cytochrome/quinol oxidase subunit 1